QGMAVGMIVTLLFALLPLLSIRKISPLRALRASVSNEDGKDPLRFVIYGLIGAGLVGFAVWLTGDWVTGFWFAAGLVAVFALLAGTAYVLMWALRRVPLGGLPYVWRQGLANLYRPNNQTRVLVLSLGLGTFLLMTLYLTQRALIGQVEFAGIQSQANTILFDIQPTQVEGVTNIIEEQGLPLFERTPVVTMRLQRVNGRSVEALRDDSTYTGDRWPLFREYRSTYRDSLTAAETILEGDWHGNVAYDPSRPAEISIEQDIASDLGVGIGDELTFDVQGLPVQTRITSIREIDWQRLSSNFFVIFQPGVLEEAPQFFIATTRATGDEAGGRLQQAIVRAYPNVSVIDLDLILQTAEQILGRVSFVVQFMALFSIFTGLLVLLSAVAISRFQRVRESVLLRTLGASGGQVRQINGVEYLLLGMLATLTGLLLSIGGAWALARFTFDIPFSPPLMPILVAFVGVAGLTVLVGFLSSRGVSRRTPLEVLRSA
ncbi:MAG: FtsX-like permease family protein, partial [Bacteroidota bacterium]